MYFIVKLVITLGFVKREERRTKEEGRGGGGGVKLEQRKLVWKFIYIYKSLFQQGAHREDMDSLLIWFLFFFCFVFKYLVRTGSQRTDRDERLQSPPAVLGRWGPADADDVRQDTRVRLSPRGFSWSGVWLTVAVPLISALFMLLSQRFISRFIPHSFIPQYISADGIGCSNDSLWGRLITECSGSYWYQKSVEWAECVPGDQNPNGFDAQTTSE